MKNQLTEQKGTMSKPSESLMTLRLPKLEGEGLATYEAPRTGKIHKYPEVFTAFKIMLENTRGTEIGDTEASMLLEAMKRDEVSIYELDLAFWKAYKDPYTPKTGIEYKHLWKHISENRDNTYRPPKD